MKIGAGPGDRRKLKTFASRFVGFKLILHLLNQLAIILTDVESNFYKDQCPNYIFNYIVCLRQQSD